MAETVVGIVPMIDHMIVTMIMTVTAARAIQDKGEVTVSAPNADRAVVTFTAHPAEGVDAERLLAGLALRCARDVLALLPVVQVDVTGKLDSGETLTVTYPYSSLRKAAFGFIDPARYARELGGTFEL